MNLKERLWTFEQLGIALQQLSKDDLERLTLQAQSRNSWFTPDNVLFALKGLQKYLSKECLEDFVSHYSLENLQAKRIGVVMAGNIPLVGVHDWLCVLLSGHYLYAKLSSQDNFLLKEVSKILCQIEPRFEDKIHFVEQLKGIDAIIATGSDNSAKYFEYYFSKYPNIIRKNRTSCAVLNGKESQEELEKLGQDIFKYFGLGCRNISKIFVPKGYDFDRFFKAIEIFKNVIHQHRYSNNYDYNKSIYLINRVPHFDNGFLMLTMNESLFSPISVLYYEEYENAKNVEEHINNQLEKVQCVCASNTWFPNSIDLGIAQMPSIFDYADGIDTMDFLTHL